MMKRILQGWIAAALLLCGAGCSTLSESTEASDARKALEAAKAVETAEAEKALKAADAADAAAAKAADEAENAAKAAERAEAAKAVEAAEAAKNAAAEAAAAAARAQEAVKTAEAAKIAAAAQAAKAFAGEPLLKAFVADDAKAFLALLPEVVSVEFGEQGFRKTRASMQEQLGTPVSYEYVLNLEHPTYTVSVWRVRFERKSSDGKKIIHQECLFRAVSGKVNGQERLLQFHFL